MEKVKKHLNYLFLNTTPKDDTETWKRVAKSVEFAEAMNGKTETYDFIADASPTEELESYAPVLAQTQSAYMGDPIYDYLFSLYEKQATGTDAVTQAMIVYQQKNAEKTANRARQNEVLITIDTVDNVAGTIKYNISQRGTPTLGTAVVDESGNPVFTPESNTEEPQEP